VGSNPIGHPNSVPRNPPPRKWTQPPLAQGASAGAAFVAGVGAAVAHVRANARGAALGRDPEHLHQVRIGIRRLRSTLRAFRGLIRRRRALRFERALRAAQRALGTARDWDEFVASRFAPDLRRAARRPRALAQQSVRRILTGVRFNPLTREVLDWSRSNPWRAASNPGQALAGFGARALQRLYGALCRRAAGIDWADAERRHRVRIRLKRLRYGCECFAAVFARDETEPLLHCMRRLQHLLGELNDIQVQRRLLRELAGDAGLAQAAERARRLLDAREGPLIRDAEKAWSKFEAVPPYWRHRAVPGRE
jgi:CHAD domain-containing protein